MTSMDKVLMSAIETVENRVDAITAGSDSSSSSTVLAHTHPISDITNLQTNLDTINNDITTLKKSGDTFNPFKDKWVSIIGDSISTYEGYIPDGNTTWYPNDDVNDVSKTWWHQLLTKLGAKLCVNESWSGRWVVGDFDKAASKVVADNTKLKRVAGQTYVNLDGSTEEAKEDIEPDIILCLIGINDFKNGSTLGTYSNSVVKDMNTDFYSAYNALCLYLIGEHSKAQVYCLEITYTSELNFLGANSKGNKYIDFNTAIHKNAELYNINVIHTSKIGVSGTNGEAFLIDKIHPKANMMERIANQCYNEMMANNFL